MPRRGKNYRNALEKIDRQKQYELAEGLALVLDTAFGKFDHTIEIAARLGVDPRKADQMVRGTVQLPHGVGKKVTVLVFAKGDRFSAIEPPSWISDRRFRVLDFNPAAAKAKARQILGLEFERLSF